MGPRILLLAALAFPATPQSPPPMFPPWYAQALQNILDLEPADAALLESTLADQPDDQPTRLKLMAYHQRADRIQNPADRAKRLQHALWLIEHHPDSPLLHSPVSRFTPSDLTRAQLQHATALWTRATASLNPAILWNAANFYEPLDPTRHLQYLEATAAAAPNHPYALRPLAHAYALALLHPGPAANHARAALDASSNVWILGNAAYMLQSQANRNIGSEIPNSTIRQLAVHYFLQAKALDPNLDRKAILPQLPPPQTQTAQTAPPPPPVRELPITAFPNLPAPIAQTLQARGCRIPQPTNEGPPANIIQGEFFAKGETAYAALCTHAATTTLLTFRNANDTTPQTITTTPNGTPNRQITPVGRTFILRHYRAYGGPEPPPIDHQAIDDAFLEKASITWYFHKGKWLQLQGAD